MGSTHVHDVVVVGGGLAGLTAAWHLRDLDTVLLESEERLGGRIRSERRGDYWLNFGAHVFGAPSSATGRLLDELRVSAVEVPGALAAVAMNGKVVVGGPVELLPLRLPLQLGARIALARAGLKLRRAVHSYAKVARLREGESPAERQSRVLAFLDDRSFGQFIGRLSPDVHALFAATLTRSSGEPDELAAGYGIGYFQLVWDRGSGLTRNIVGGSARVIEALAADLAERVRSSARVTLVEREGGGVRVRYSSGASEHELLSTAAVVATPAYVTREVVRDLPADVHQALGAVRYGPYVVGAFLTNEERPMPWDRIYALATPNRSFSMLFNTANVLRTAGPRSKGGSLMVYASADAARSLASLDDTAVAERFALDLCELFPVASGVVEEIVVRRWDRGLPFAAPGRSRIQDALTRSLAPIHLAGDYLGTSYTETAIETALRAASGARSLAQRDAQAR